MRDDRMKNETHGIVRGDDAVVLSRRNAVIAVYHGHDQASDAIRTVLQCGFDRNSLSLVARDRLVGVRAMSDDHADGAITPWGKLGVFGPGLWGPVIGWMSLWVPGLGPLLIGGPLVSLILGAHDGAAVFGSFTALGAALYRIGIPKESIRRYEEAIRKGRHLLIVQGTPDVVTPAGRLLSGTGAAMVALHVSRTGDAPCSADKPEVMDGSRPTGALHPSSTLTGGSHDDTRQVSDHQRD